MASLAAPSPRTILHRRPAASLRQPGRLSGAPQGTSFTPAVRQPGQGPRQVRLHTADPAAAAPAAADARSPSELVDYVLSKIEGTGGWGRGAAAAQCGRLRAPALPCCRRSFVADHGRCPLPQTAATT